MATERIGLKETPGWTRRMSGIRSISGYVPWMAASYAVAVAVVFASPLSVWASAAWASDDNSHVLLIPFVSLYLALRNRRQLPRDRRGASILGGLLLLAGLLVLAASWFGPIVGRLSLNDTSSVQATAFVVCVLAGGYFFWGKECMRVQAFPASFLCFMIPLPDGVVKVLEIGSQFASAETASVLFSIGGVPFVREGNVFQLPGIVLRVAQECSGIRSSLVLFITSVLASNLFLQSTWRRLVLVGIVVPLGILRNGFRILVVGLLCVNAGPQMIDSWIHRRGGPLFFGLALIPLFLVLLVLRKGDHASNHDIQRRGKSDDPGRISDCSAWSK